MFLDTTYKTVIGLLDSNLEWSEFQVFEAQKASAFLQSEVYKICENKNIFFKHLKGVVFLSGPGFYTGLRVSEGFADIAQLFGVPSYSFYSFDVPKFLGINSGLWITKAYKGEYFIHRWNMGEHINSLVSTKEFNPESLNHEDTFIHTDGSIDFQSPINLKNSLQMIKENPSRLFSRVIEDKLKKEIFYFRAPEDEFRTNP